MTFSPDYVRLVLTDNFEDAKAMFLAPLMAIHYAHLAMLAEQRIVATDDARSIRAALDGIDLAAVRRAPYDASAEDLFFHVNHLLADACGPDVAGRLHTARSRNDIDMTMYRLCVHEWVLTLADEVVAMRREFVNLAARHRDTVFPAHTHTQPAQPTTVAHYLLAVIEQLERDTVRLVAAYETTNRSPLGACAITGTGFPIDRDRTSALLGFSGPTGNTYGSIATVDYLVESAGAAAVMLIGLGRFVQDMLLWSTSEVGYLRLPDGFVQPSSIMPQKRNPVALEHARALASKAFAEAQAIGQVVHNTPFGDIVDTEDDLQPLVAAAFRDSARAVELVTAAIAGAEFDVARMRARAAEGWVSVTELADVLTRDRGLSFGLAHAIVSRFVQVMREAGESGGFAPALLRASAELGHEVRLSEAALRDLLSPDHFVAVRRTHGGPAPDVTAKALEAARQQIVADAERLTAMRSARSAADLLRRAAVDAL